MLREEMPEWLKQHIEFQNRVDNWDKNRSTVFADKREAAYQFALEVLDADPVKAREFINRTNIQWDIIKSYFRHLKQKVGRMAFSEWLQKHMVHCKVCGNEDYGGYWCRPCIHHDFCCECCILMGAPNYSVGMAIIGKRKCQYCGTEFTDVIDSGSSTNLGLGAKLIKTDDKKSTCPKCGR